MCKQEKLLDILTMTKRSLYVLVNYICSTVGTDGKQIG